MTSQLQLGDFAPRLDRSKGQWHTPRTIAHKMAQLVRGRSVLEPSAGGGNLVEPVLHVATNVVAIEIDPKWCEVLRNRFDRFPVQVIAADFLDIDPVAYGPFDCAVMNPPLGAGEGPHHVVRALELAPQVISVLRAGDLHTRDAYKTLWSRCDLAFLANLIARGGFQGALTDFVVVDVRRRGTLETRPTVEWWEA